MRGRASRAFRCGCKQLRAHHRRQRQRHEARHDHRAGERPGELDEQPPGAAGHEADRRVDRGQRQRHGDDGEADLCVPISAASTGCLAILDVAVDVLQHDDGVVDDEADRQHQREQRQRVDGEAEHVHQREGADQRHRDGDERDERGAEGAQEEEDDQHDEHDGFADGLEDGLDRLAR